MNKLDGVKPGDVLAMWSGSLRHHHVERVVVTRRTESSVWTKPEGAEEWFSERRWRARDGYEPGRGRFQWVKPWDEAADEVVREREVGRVAAVVVDLVSQAKRAGLLEELLVVDGVLSEALHALKEERA